jgi:hypothetical protein
MKWSVFLVVGVGIVLLIIGWRGTHNNLWQSLGGTVNNTTPTPKSIFPTESINFTPQSMPTIPAILTNPTLAAINVENLGSPFGGSGASSNPASPGSGQGSPTNVESLSNFLQLLHG